MAIFNCTYGEYSFPLWHLHSIMAGKLSISVSTTRNYFTGKSAMVVILQSKDLYRVATSTEKEPNQDSKCWKPKALGLICLSVSPELLFHLEGIDTPHEAWEQLELFGKTNVIHNHQLENEFDGLNPNNFDTMQDFISKFKSLIRVQLKNCKIENKRLIYAVLSKLLLCVCFHILFN